MPLSFGATMRDGTATVGAGGSSGVGALGGGGAHASGSPTSPTQRTRPVTIPQGSDELVDAATGVSPYTSRLSSSSVV